MLRHALVLVVILATGPRTIFGQAGKDQIIQKLIARVEALEREVAALQQTGVVAGKAAPPEPASIAPRQEPVAAVELPSPEPEASRFTFHSFATARISPKLTALVETVLETDNQLAVASVPVNVERLLLQYRQNDYFNLDIGSYRTAIGFYSTAYLRGSWLQTALTRPKLLTFEDDGGFLPLHNVGLSASGKLPSGDLGLHYVAEVCSSRNYANPGRTGLDFEQNGAFNVALYARPRGVPGLEIGFSSYRDKFSPLPGFAFSRSVWTVHAVYQANRFEFLNEAILARFSEPGIGHGNVGGFYNQLAYRYAPQYVPWRTVSSDGLRYDMSEAVAFKFELGRGNGPVPAGLDTRGSTGGVFTF